MIETIKGPHFDKSNNRWEIRWVENGKSRCKTSKRQSTLVRFRDRLESGRPKCQLKPIKRFDGSATQFKQAIADSVLAMNQAAIANDGSQLDVLRKYNKGLAEAASAIVPHAGYIELEEEFRKLLAYVQKLQAQKAVTDAEKPEALRRPDSTFEAATRSN